jgi:hypothetical protein
MAIHQIRPDPGRQARALFLQQLIGNEKRAVSAQSQGNH